ncbi:MAG: SPOR domain-containing protein [Gammaproteobacteria bacterium]
MPRDYAKRTTKKEVKKSPKWRILLSAFIVLSAVCGFAYWHFSNSHTQNQSPIVIEAKPTKTFKQLEAKKEKPLPEVQFQFYSMLSNMKVQADTTTPKPSYTPDQHSYFLQLGAFYTKDPAEKLQARLQLLGLDTSIDSITSKTTGRTIYRLQAGPYPDYKTAQQRQYELAQAKIESMIRQAS